MINFSQDQENQFNELLSKAFENAQTFNQHKNKNKTMNLKLIREALNEGAEYIMEVTNSNSEIANDILQKMSSAFNETFKNFDNEN